jgi:hypothetical protein
MPFGSSALLTDAPSAAAIAERAPHIELLFELRIGTEHDHMAEHIAACPESLDDVSLRVGIGVNAKEARSNRRAADQLRRR